MALVWLGRVRLGFWFWARWHCGKGLVEAWFGLRHRVSTRKRNVHEKSKRTQSPHCRKAAQMVHSHTATSLMLQASTPGTVWSSTTSRIPTSSRSRRGGDADVRGSRFGRWEMGRGASRSFVSRKVSSCLTCQHATTWQGTHNTTAGYVDNINMFILKRTNGAFKFSISLQLFNVKYQFVSHQLILELGWQVELAANAIPMSCQAVPFSVWPTLRTSMALLATMASPSKPSTTWWRWVSE